MSKLSVLEKNAYINILIKDNGIWAHLAYTDFNANREYILSDYTDLNALKFLLDDNVFTKEFWFEYFDTVEKVFDWDIVDKDKDSVFTFRDFKAEGDGVSGVRVQIDDNQDFFTEIFNSVRDFSNEVSLRVIDDAYLETMLKGLSQRIDIDDLLVVDMDLFHFSVFRVTAEYEKGRPTGHQIFSKSKMSWKDEIPLIDSIKDARFGAFLSTELSEKNLQNTWANFVIDRPIFVQDRPLLDIVRSYATIQNFSLFRDNRKKIETFGREYTRSAMIITGNIPRVLGKSKTLMTIIDGLEITGNFDCYFDLDLRTIAYGKSYVEMTESTDIILTRNSLLPKMTKVIIPQTKPGMKNRVVFSGKVQGVDTEQTDFYAISSQFTMIEMPPHENRLLIEGTFRNGVKMIPLGETKINYMSTPESTKIDSILFDCRPRPIVYGPDAHSNKLKLQSWLNDY